ncbi:MAG: ABC transporter ATP-binding protein [Desulfitobacteriaceae bacterium]
MNVLEVQDLHTYFFTERGTVPAVNGIDFAVPSGRTVAIVGESGSGKSVAVQSVLRLITSPGKIVQGRVLFNSEDLLKKSEKELRRIRGNQISMIFQEPMSSLNPVFTCGEQVIEVLRLHQKCSRKEARRKAQELFELVGIPAPGLRLNEYPDQLSGGMRQRVMIAIALACRPQILIADEPTTALDVTIQAQILELMKSLQSQLGMAIILITHDMGVVAETADLVIVMYGGKVVENGTLHDIFERPHHPYTQGLLFSIPRLQSKGKLANERLYSIEGTVPDPNNLPEGCSFWPRCSEATDNCKKKPPRLSEVRPGHQVSCWLYEKEAYPYEHSG